MRHCLSLLVATRLLAYDGGAILVKEEDEQVPFPAYVSASAASPQDVSAPAEGARFAEVVLQSEAPPPQVVLQKECPPQVVLQKEVASKVVYVKEAESETPLVTIEIASNTPQKAPAAPVAVSNATVEARKAMVATLQKEVSKFRTQAKSDKKKAEEDDETTSATTTSAATTTTCTTEVTTPDKAAEVNALKGELESLKGELRKFPEDDKKVVVVTTSKIPPTTTPSISIVQRLPVVLPVTANSAENCALKREVAALKGELKKRETEDSNTTNTSGAQPQPSALSLPAGQPLPSQQLSGVPPTATSTTTPPISTPSSTTTTTSGSTPTPPPLPARTITTHADTTVDASTTTQTILGDNSSPTSLAPALASRSQPANACDLPNMPWSTAEGIAAKNAQWLPMAFEIEMYFKPKDKDEGEMMNLVGQQMSSLKYTGNCSKRLFRISPDADKMKEGWVWETEAVIGGANYAGQGASTLWELASPISLSEEETELACRQTSILEPSFKKQMPEAAGGTNAMPGLHVHVDSRCLLEDERRLVALILVWDKYFNFIQKLTASDKHSDEASKFSRLFSKSYPQIFNHLEKYIAEDGKAWMPARGAKELTQVFVEGEPHDGSDDPHSGYRRQIVNVCHLLDVKCAHDYPEKNIVPKFGAIEFRGFDATLGRGLRLIMLLMQRLVQVFCSIDLDQLLGLVTAKEPDVHQLLTLLGVNDIMQKHKFGWNSDGT